MVSLQRVNLEKPHGMIIIMKKNGGFQPEMNFRGIRYPVSVFSPFFF